MSQQISAAGGRTALRQRRSQITLAAFVIGLPLGLGALAFLHYGPPQANETVARYVSNPIEWVEIVLFGCALGGLLWKVWGQTTERAAFRRHLLPEWDGQPMPAREASPLADDVVYTGRRWQNTFLVRRILAILDFVSCRGSSDGLDDHLRTLSDNDHLAQEGSYSLIRFITWAIPILGFLGTVVGITAAIAGVSPEKLQEDLGSVTQGLTYAFDTTAVALGLTMVLMFCNFLVERLENGTLEDVDHYVDLHLAHRFERSSQESNIYVDVVRQNTKVLLDAIEKSAEQQTTIWSAALERSENRWLEEGEKQQERFGAALDSALDRTLASHTQRVGDLQHSLTHIAELMTQQIEIMRQLREGEAELLKLQETLQQNLATLASAGAFDEAVQSLTAAIHLLTGRFSNPANRQIKPAA